MAIVIAIRTDCKNEYAFTALHAPVREIILITGGTFLTVMGVIATALTKTY